MGESGFATEAQRAQRAQRRKNWKGKTEEEKAERKPPP
jgi:hypothetical protein